MNERDAMLLARLLRMRSERPTKRSRRRAADKTDEFPPPHARTPPQDKA
jgi:hypothetical protein